MAKSNFDDFLLDPDFDDLDSVHLEAQRQLYGNGGLKKKVKGLFKKKKKKKGDDAVSDKQAAEIDKVANTNPKGGQSTVQTKSPKLTKKAPKRGKIEVKKEPTKNPLLKKVEVKKEMKRVDPSKTKRGTGVTYKAAWDANRNNVKSIYKTFAEFKAAAEAHNKKSDAKKAKAKQKSQSTATKVGNKLVSATEKKKLLSKNWADKIPTGGNKKCLIHLEMSIKHILKSVTNL
jgi:hypothetical protein